MLCWGSWSLAPWDSTLRPRSFALSFPNTTLSVGSLKYFRELAGICSLSMNALFILLSHRGRPSTPLGVTQDAEPRPDDLGADDGEALRDLAASPGPGVRACPAIVLAAISARLVSTDHEVLIACEPCNRFNSEKSLMSPFHLFAATSKGPFGFALGVLGVVGRELGDSERAAEPGTRSPRMP